MQSSFISDKRSKALDASQVKSVSLVVPSFKATECSIQSQNWQIPKKKRRTYLGLPEMFAYTGILKMNKKLESLDQDYIPKLIEDTLDCVFMALETVEGKNRSFTIFRAFRVYLRLRTGKSTWKNISTFALPYIKQILGDMVEIQSTDQFEESLKFAREAFNSTKQASESPLLKKLYKCAMFAMTYSLFENIGVTFDTFGYSKLEEAVIQKKFLNKGKFAICLVDTLLFICERGFQVYKTGDINTIFHSGGVYSDLYEVTLKLKRQNNLLNNPEEHGFTEPAFRAELDEVIEKLTSMDKHAYRLNDYDRKSIKCLLNEMFMLRDDLNTKAAARRMRKAPFSVLVHGDSGVGKSYVTEMLYKVFAKLNNLPTGSEFKYTLNFASKHWNNFTSSVHTIIMDDAANEHPNLGDASSVNQIIQIVNNTAYCPEQAALENKGRTPLLAKFVIATTNVKDLNASAYFTCPSAVQRRFPFIITPVVREAYRKEDGTLDSDKVPHEPFPDCWTYKVESVRPTPMEGKKHLSATLVLVADAMGQVEFFQWFRDAVDNFQKNQHKVQESIASMDAVELCDCCRIPATMCPVTVQSLDHFKNTGVILFYLIPLATLIFTILNFCILRKFRLGVLEVKKLIRTHVIGPDPNLTLDDKIIQYNAKIDEIKSCYQTVQYWRDVGERMKNKIGHHTILISVLSFAGGSYALYRMFSSSQNESIQSKDEDYERTGVGSTPVAELNGRENVWINNALDLSQADFTRASSSAKSQDFNSFCKMISENVALITVDHPTLPDKARTSRVLCLGGHIYVTNNHGIPSIPEETSVEFIESSTSQGVNQNMSFTITEMDLERYPERDIVFIFIRNLPPKKKILKYIRDSDMNGVFNGRYISRTRTGAIECHDVKKIQLNQSKRFKDPRVNLDAVVDVWSGYCKYKTQNGFCGSPLIIQSHFGYSIVGFHLAKHDITADFCFSTAFDGKFFTSIYDKHSKYGIQSGDFSLVSSESHPRELVDLHKKSLFRYIPEGSAKIFGSFSGFRGGTDSKVSHTPMSHHLSNEGYKIRFTKPVMKSWVPWHIGAKDLLRPIARLNSLLLERSKEDYCESVFENLDNPMILKTDLIILDDFTAINGAQQQFIDKMNRNTSAGLPYRKSKRNFMTSIPPMHGMQDPVKVDDEIMDRVVHIINQYKQGICVHPNFCAHLKDEPVSFKKAKIGKTRVFAGAPFDWCIVVRKYLLTFCRVLQSERIAFESCPGTIAQSLEWHELYLFLSDYGTTNIIAGDYKAFDKKMSPVEVLSAFDIIIHFCRLSGNYTAEDIVVIRCIAEDTAYSLMDYNGDLIQVFGSNPSGNPLTVILNCLVNCVRMRYVFYKIKPSNVRKNFRSVVHLLTYGDDLVASVKNGYSWYNHTSVASAFADIDVVFTMADKESESVPYITLDKATFLKRSWVINDEINCMFAPLEHESIEKMLMVWTRSKQITEEFQGMEIIKTALREYFWYGRNVFNQKSDMLKQLVHNLQWDIWIEESTFPTFDSLLEDFQKASRHCRTYGVFYQTQDIDYLLPGKNSEVPSSSLCSLEDSNSQA